jgi:hypothetical protein
VLENFFIGPPELGESTQYTMNAFALNNREFSVLEVRLVDYLGDFLEHLVFQRETLEQRFKGAVIAVMAEIHIEHVVGDGFRDVGGLWGKNKLRVGIDVRFDEPGGRYAIHFGTRARQPDAFLKIGATHALCRLALRAAEALQFLPENQRVMLRRSLEEIDLLNLRVANPLFFGQCREIIGHFSLICPQ